MFCFCSSSNLATENTRRERIRWTGDRIAGFFFSCFVVRRRQHLSPPGPCCTAPIDVAVVMSGSRLSFTLLTLSSGSLTALAYFHSQSETENSIRAPAAVQQQQPLRLHVFFSSTHTLLFVVVILLVLSSPPHPHHWSQNTRANLPSLPQSSSSSRRRRRRKSTLSISQLTVVPFHSQQ